MSRHIGYARFGKGADTGEVRELGRKMLGSLIQRMELTGARTAALTRGMPDGTRVVARFDGTVPSVVAFPPDVKESEESELDLWIPTGFVVEPANADAKEGWGVPPLPGDSDDDAHDAHDPGTKTARWTRNGALPQVLLSAATDAGYPDDPDASQWLYFDDDDAPADDVELPDDDAAWAAYRIRFRDLGPAFDAILKEVNARRASTDPLVGPFAGYADLAAYISKAGVGPDSSYPIGARTLFRRLEKEGTVLALATDVAHGTLGGGTLTEGGTAAEVVDALADALPSLTNDDLKAGSSLSIVGGAQFFLALVDHGKQWVHCGNIDWVSANAEIPRLSWFGPRGRCMPAFEMATGLYPTALVGTAYAMRPYLIDEAKRKLGNLEQREFDRHIYARGRLLAQLPNDGYVLGAAVQKIPQQDDAPDVYRLVAIAWHRADQKWTELVNASALPATPSPGWFDTTSDIRVWHVDLPTRAGLTCAPPCVVDGLFDEATNPFGWKGGTRMRLSGAAQRMHAPGNFINGDGTHGAGTQGYTAAELAAPKVYWHPWFFDGAGEHAVCLRGDTFGGRGDFGVFWAAMLWPSQMLRLTAVGGFFPALTLDSIWEVGGDPGTDVPNPAVFAPPTAAAAARIVGADYVGAELRLVQLTGGEYPNYVLSSAAGVLEDYSDFIGTSHRFGMAYLDARNDQRVAITYLGDFAAAPPGGEPPQSARIDARGPNFSGSSGFTETTFRAAWFDLNGFNLTAPDSPSMTQAPFGLFTTVGSSFATGNFRFFDAPSSARGGDGVSGWRYGTIDMHTPFDVTTRANGIASSIGDIGGLLDVEDGWLNFSGVP